MRREAGRRPMWERTAGVEARSGAWPGKGRLASPGGGLPATQLRADPRELPPENGAEVPENESSDHTRLCGALRQGAKKSGPQSGGPEQLP